MEAVIRKLVDEGFSITFVKDPITKGNLLVDMKRVTTRRLASLSPNELQTSDSAVKIIVEDLAEKIIKNKKKKY